MCATCTGPILTVVGIKEILKALNYFLAAAKTEHCFCSEILLFQSNPVLQMYSQIKVPVRSNILSL